jgi:hypothetical protein
MSEILKASDLIKAITYEYENGDLSKEDYLELVKDINTAKMIAETVEEQEQLTKLNGIINSIITGVSLVA